MAGSPLRLPPIEGKWNATLDLKGATATDSPRISKLRSASPATLARTAEHGAAKLSWQEQSTGEPWLLSANPKDSLRARQESTSSSVQARHAASEAREVRESEASKMAAWIHSHALSPACQRPQQIKAEVKKPPAPPSPVKPVRTPRPKPPVGDGPEAASPSKPAKIDGRHRNPNRGAPSLVVAPWSLPDVFVLLCPDEGSALVRCEIVLP